MNKNNKHIQTFFIPGTLPGMNEIISASKKRYNKIPYYSVIKNRYTSIIINAIKAAQIKPVEQFKLDIEWAEINRKRDPDNIAAGIKFILDSLIKTGIIKNDGWAQNKGWTNHFIVDNQPKIKVNIISILNR